MYKICLLFISVFFVVSSTFSQNIDFRNYTIKDGLAQNTITYIMQDSDGYLWFGTQLGVSKFDGKEFQNFKISDGLANNYILTIFEDSRDDIWIGTREGVSKYNGQEFVNYTEEDGLVNKNVKFIEELENGNLVFATSAGVSVFNGEEFTNYTQKGKLPNNNVTHVYKDEGSGVWLGLAEGMARLSDDSLKVFTEKEGFTNDIVWDITSKHSGKLWIATQNKGLFEYSNGKFKNYTTQDGLHSNMILSLYLDDNNDLWMGSYKSGVAKYNGKTFSTLKEKTIADKIILEIKEDPNNNLWFRSARNGVFKYRNKQLRNFTEKNNLIENYSDSKKGLLKVDREGNVWIGTVSGISKYGKAIFEHFTDNHGLYGNNILAVSANREDDVWVSTYNGLMHYDGEQFETYKNLNDIYCIYNSGSEKVVFGSNQSIYVFNNGQFTQYKDTSLFTGFDDYVHGIQPGKDNSYWLATEKGLVKFQNGVFKQIAIDSLKAKSIEVCDNAVWVSTGNGVYHYHPSSERIHSIKVEDGLPNNNCRDLTPAKDCGVWVGTDNGLVHINADHNLKIYNAEKGMHSNSIYLVQRDKEGAIWAGHEKGIEKIIPKTGEISHYGPREGFYPLETNEGAVSLDEEGNLWLGTVDGLVKYVPENDRINEMPPQTYIRSIKLFDKTTDFSEYADSTDIATNLPVDLELPYNKNYLTFEFVGLHYTNPEKVRYKFMLEGFDDDWSEPIGQRTATYKKIPNGEYTFKVKARNNDGVWNKEPITYSFTIEPPFWKTWWFYTLIGLVILFLVYQIIKARERKLIHDKKVLEQKVEERTREIAQQKEKIEKANEELRTKQEQILTQKDEIQKQRDLAEQQRDQISKQKQEITDSILYAERIQQAILPPEDYCKSILPEHFILFKPRDIVSGDYYWMTEKNNKTIVVAADCTGHGVPGAFMSMLGVSFLNEIVNTMSDLQAHLILNRLRYYVKKTLYQTRDDSQTKDGMDLALCIIDHERKVLQYAGAYNPLYYIRDGELYQIKADRMPIGIHIREKDTFTKHELELQSGDVFYIFSDGYVDQFGGENGRKFKSKPFKRLLKSIHQKPMNIQQQELDKTIVEWQGDHHQVDDIIVIGFRVTF